MQDDSIAPLLYLLADTPPTTILAFICLCFVAGMLTLKYEQKKWPSVRRVSDITVTLLYGFAVVVTYALFAFVLFGILYWILHLFGFAFRNWQIVATIAALIVWRVSYVRGQQKRLPNERL